MLALTLHRPWPWAIFHLPPEYAKRVENRTWRPPAKIIGQRIAIHAGLRYDRDAEDTIQVLIGDTCDLPLTAFDMGIVGTVRVGGYYSAVYPTDPAPIRDWFCGPFGWLLDDVRRLPEPIPCKGAQGLWRVPDEIAARLA